MKSLYPKGKGKIHPSPSCPAGGSGAGDAVAALTLLPAAIAALTAALRAEDREVLAYMVARSLEGPWSSSSSSGAGGEVGRRRCWRLGRHRPLFSCGCFDCYTSYWFRWDSSPDRELIHQAIEAFEDHLASSERMRQPARKDRSERARGRPPDDKGKQKRRPGKEKKEKKEKREKGEKREMVPGGFGGGEGPSAVVREVEEVMEEMEEKVYYAELVLESELGDGAGESREAAAAGMEMVVVQQPQQQGGGERRRGWADVMGLLNSRFWSLWSPGGA